MPVDSINGDLHYSELACIAWIFSVAVPGLGYGPRRFEIKPRSALAWIDQGPLISPKRMLRNNDLDSV